MKTLELNSWPRSSCANGKGVLDLVSNSLSVQFNQEKYNKAKDFYHIKKIKTFKNIESLNNYCKKNNINYKVKKAKGGHFLFYGNEEGYFCCGTKEIDLVFREEILGGCRDAYSYGSIYTIIRYSCDIKCATCGTKEEINEITTYYFKKENRVECICHDCKRKFENFPFEQLRNERVLIEILKSKI